MSNRIIILTLAVLLQNAGLRSQSLTLSADTLSIRIGEQISANITLKTDQNDSILFPVIDAGEITDHLEIVELSELDTTLSEEGYFSINQTVKITSFDSGFWALPPFKAIVNGDSIESEPLLIEVNTVTIDTATTELSDIKPPLELPYTFTELLLKYGWIGLLVLVLGLLLWWYLKYGRKRAPTEPIVTPEQSVDPFEEALKKLNELEQKALWQNNKHKAFHVAWSEIIRDFLERVYRIPARESTTDEIKTLLRRVDLTQETKRSLIEAFKISDLVKFAKTTPIKDENLYCLEIAKRVIRESKERQQRTQESEHKEE